MIGGDTAASAGSNRAAADHPPAQPLSLLAVLQQEFKGNSTVRRQAQARRSTAAGPQMKIWLGFIGGSTVCPLRVPPSAGALHKDSREHRRSVVQRIANGKLSRSLGSHIIGKMCQAVGQEEDAARLDFEQFTKSVHKYLESMRSAACRGAPS